MLTVINNIVCAVVSEFWWQ